MVSFKDALTTHRLVAIVRGGDARAAVRVLFESGVRLVEVSLTSPDALEVIADLASEVPEDGLLGVGTIRTPADVDGALAAGAAFAVSPATTIAVRASVAAGLPVLAGVLTPTEVETALGYGADAAKLFPASLGGVDYLKALRAPFPDVPFVPVGGVGVEEAVAYLGAGAVAVGVGSPLLGDDLAGLPDRAKRFLDAIGASA
ncbi:bifunctional 4-hydroxy-2-oxoglutarate aldolase/2-dehydro-3-deoxy-phosphogluconate aldolase [Umezawaea endophytica]|uniref:Bifunctional 4-hydroxy-2-oxoglutarate aldolase/2-dehydro-3-deoxy-phosphogluconate aldolase n=1 Tax=Umezawaea endophytica TaxID=1654476 RepID=A0A9X2VWH8_9PSEU|nr:bifunctional 4-hydroxy-2-oxoglutarate aldolase/2-dehydro-3-deoxy-phosphogluconate aldolase [Umezawaea endophytica]MCS7483965.1 bifunctional 4-hydroxy-2-oxoglutarate aldolase/2-dehydro-3-deoxy-phosphogluconate aldolase [Umezawaea endophytica]